ncbi:MAG TPA: homoserine dehydrogenase [Candidatus Dormibacteraeota bacterium]
MAQAPSVGIGMLGLGTVGQQVAARLAERRDLIRRNTGVDLLVKRVLVRQPSKPRAISLDADVLTTDAASVIDDPGVDVVVEVMGGEEPARSYLERAIRAGKHVVTANKVVMAKHGPQLLELAAERNVDVYFEAAAGGGIPLISTFKVDLQANEIESIAAVINGTTNHMLTRMRGAGLDFHDALREAQAAGFAEADPTDDVGGYDARYKLAILASIAFRTRIHPDQVYREGIEAIEPVDFIYAGELGYDIKLLAYAARSGDGIEARVHPAMIPTSHPLGQVEGAFNAVYIEGDLVGPVLLYGQGAGGRPTASAVIGDLIDLVIDIRRCVQSRPAAAFDANLRLLAMDEVVTRAYFRMHVADRPGVLAAIGQAFADEGVSISSAIQKEVFAEHGTAEFVVTTHRASDRALRATLDRLAGLDSVAKLCSFLRVF